MDVDSATFGRLAGREKDRNEKRVVEQLGGWLTVGLRSWLGYVGDGSGPVQPRHRIVNEAAMGKLLEGWFSFWTGLMDLGQRGSDLPEPKMD